MTRSILFYSVRRLSGLSEQQQQKETIGILMVKWFPYDIHKQLLQEKTPSHLQKEINHSVEKPPHGCNLAKKKKQLLQKIPPYLQKELNIVWGKSHMVVI